MPVGRATPFRQPVSSPQFPPHTTDAIHLRRQILVGMNCRELRQCSIPGRNLGTPVMSYRNRAGSNAAARSKRSRRLNKLLTCSSIKVSVSRYSVRSNGVAFKAKILSIKEYAASFILNCISKYFDVLPQSLAKAIGNPGITDLTEPADTSASATNLRPVAT